MRIGRAIRAFVLFAALIVFVAFSIANRSMVEISFAPVPYLVQIPLFLLALLCFSLGIFLAWLLLVRSIVKSKRLASREHARAMALENEIKSLRLEQENKGVPALRQA